MMSYMQGQDLWEVVNKAKLLNRRLRMRMVYLEMEDKSGAHSRCQNPYEAWNTLTKLFSKKNGTRLQLLESELLSIAQCNLTIAQDFHKGWQNQPSLVEFENLLAGQEALAKQMGGVSLKGEEEVLYAHKGRWNSKQHTIGRTKKNEDKTKSSQGERSARVEGDSRIRTVKNFKGSATIAERRAFFAATGESAFIATTSEQIDYEKDWIIDSGCSNHMTGDKEKLQDLSEYKGRHMVVTANNSKLPIAHIGNTVVSSQYNTNDVSLQNVYHVPGMKKIFSVAQLTPSGHFVIFSPQDVKVYRDLEIMEELTVKNETADLWHIRLSHVNYSKLTMMMKSQC
ncbi:hypothetical protein AAG906_005773 [Vitis piasezkii]